MGSGEMNFDSIFDDGNNKEAVLRIFTVLSSLQRDVDGCCRMVNKLYESDAIDELQFQFIMEELLGVSSACKKLDSTIDAIKRIIV